MTVQAFKISPIAKKGGRSWNKPMPEAAKVTGSQSWRDLDSVLTVEVSADMGML